jgi:flagellar hook protein FlgE
MSFYTSLSGLRGAQTDLSTISNNVANVGSYGFKRSRASFGDIMPASTTTAGQGTRLKGIEQQFTQGGFESSSRELDLAISGSGFFVTRAGVTGGTTYFTRNGSLTINPDRYLTDSNGAYMMVLPVDSEGNVTATTLGAAQTLQLPASSGTPAATSGIDLSVSLPSSAGSTRTPTIIPSRRRSTTAPATPFRRPSISSAPLRSPTAIPTTSGRSTCSSATSRPRPTRVRRRPRR